MSEQILWLASRGASIVSLVLSSAVVCLGLLTVVRWQRPGWPRFLTVELDLTIALIVTSLMRERIGQRAVTACPVLALRLRPVPRATMPAPAAARVPASTSGG